MFTTNKQKVGKKKGGEGHRNKGSNYELNYVVCILWYWSQKQLSKSSFWNSLTKTTSLQYDYRYDSVVSISLGRNSKQIWFLCRQERSTEGVM